MQSQAPRTMAARNVLLAWSAAWAIAQVVSLIALTLTGRSSSIVLDVPIWANAVGVLVMWVVMISVMNVMHNETPRLNSQSLRWFHSRDLVVGIPLGVASQYVLVSVVNWPLQKIWPHTFSFDDISKRATDLTNTAPGAWKVLLIAIVVVGAPVIEEIIYRGAVQQDLVKRWGPAVGVTCTAGLFAVIHMSPVEIPGLFAFALVLGIARFRTGRLGTSIITHMAFNAAGLVLVILK